MLQTMIRYVRLFAYFVAFSFSRSFEFRFDFVMRIVMDVLYYAVAISFFRIMFLHTDNLAGWNEAQMMIFVSGYIMIDAINMTLFANNMFQLPTMVNRGDLDYYLVRPVSSLFFLSLRDFAANSFINLVITLGIFAWAVQRYPEPISAGRVVLFLLLILNGNLIFYCMNMLANLPVFWAHSGQGFGSLMWSINKFAERPDRIYSGIIRRILTTTLPFCLIASFPTRLLLEPMDYKILLHTLLVSAAFFAVLIWCWNLALRHYSSASS